MIYSLLASCKANEIDPMKWLTKVLEELPIRTVNDIEDLLPVTRSWPGGYFPVMCYFVYILQSERDGSFYIGSTSDVEARLSRHNSGRTRYHVHIVY